MRGRKPKPSALRKLEGNPGKRAMPKREPTPATGATAPTWLCATGKREWKRLAAILERVGVLTEVDADALAIYCDTFARWKKARTDVNKRGITVPGAMGGRVKNPAMTILERSQEHMMKLLAEFGMTPSARTRVMRNVAADTPDPAEQFFDGPRKVS